MDDLEGRFRSPIVGDLKLPPGGPAEDERGRRIEPEKVPISPEEKVRILLEINVNYPGGLKEVRKALERLWRDFEDRAGGHWEVPDPDLLNPPAPRRLMFISRKLYQCVLSRAVRPEIRQAWRDAHRLT